MKNYKVIKGEVDTGDRVVVLMHTGTIEESFEIVTGKLTRLDEEPSGSIDGKEIDFASEGHTSTMFKIVEWDEEHALDMVTNDMISEEETLSGDAEYNIAGEAVCKILEHSKNIQGSSNPISGKRMKMDLSDIGNAIGIVVQEAIDNGEGDLSDFMNGFEHGKSIVDGTHG